MPESSRLDRADPQAFRGWLDQDWEQWLDEYPEVATLVGAPGRNDRWTDDSPSGIARRESHLRQSLAAVREFLRNDLPEGERLNYDLYLECLEAAEEGLKFGGDPFPFRLGVPHNLWMPMNQMEGIHLTAGEIVELQPHESTRDIEDLLVRLERLPAALEQNLALLQAGLQRGYSPNRIAIRGVPEQVRRLVPTDPRESPLLRPFLNAPRSVTATERDRARTEAERTIADRIAPSVRRLVDYLEHEYLPACRDSVGARDLPHGTAAYAFLVRWETTTDLSPEAIHEIGLSEVRRIRAAMEEQRAAAGFTGTLEEFNDFLRTDARFQWPSAEALLDGYRVLAKRVDPTLGRVFGRLPRLPYGVLPVPKFREESSPTAYYQPGAPATGRAGFFYTNTYEVSARPKWEMQALTLHESVPGHHLQIALAQELEGLPAFRRNSGATAFVEGWGLYAESLGEELGFYEDPYSKIGQLNYDMWRSIRLVVDTGMHFQGWTRDRAIEYFHQNSGKSTVDIAVEVDRYIVWPGQALAYKVGQLKIRELRTLCEKRLGERFDVRAFHDLVLVEGALPLQELERRVRRWLEAHAAA